MSILLSAEIPVIEVVTAIIFINFPPFSQGVSLVLHHDAFLKVTVEVSAFISSIQWYFHSI